MSNNYIKNFVVGHGIRFENSPTNREAFERSKEKWNQIEEELQVGESSIVLFCGAKSNGKSSLVRQIVNNYIKKCETPSNEVQDIDTNDEVENKAHRRYIYYVDLDPGQSEMATPGTISAHIVRSNTQPLQSPTYLNVLRHELLAMSSVGGTNMAVDPRMFIQNVRFIMNQVISHRSEQSIKRPIVINTMGFIRNVGLALLMDTIKICSPTDLVVLNVENQALRTIYADLSPAAISATPASFYYETSHRSKKLDYRYHLHNLQFSFVDSSSIATKNRTSLLLAYFGSMPEAIYKPVLQLTPKWISLDKVSIYCVSSYPLREDIVLELLIRSLIHLVKLKRRSFEMRSATLMERPQLDRLCNIVEDIGENMMLGCGIVVDIELDKRKVAIITPLNQETLDQNVDCLIKPLSIQVPREMMP